MGYLKQGKVGAFFIRTTDEQDREVIRLAGLLRRTKNKRIKRKIAKRVDNMVEVE